MSKNLKKAVVIGLDATVSKSMLKYVNEGKLPVIGKLIKDGIWGENCLVPHPTITPPNWTTIVTGAWAGTHGITCFHVHNPGDELDKTHQGFLAEDCKAEYIWNAVAEIGKKTIILNYPSTWPNAVKNGIQIGGAGLGINEYRIDAPGFSQGMTISADLLYSTEEYPQGNLVELKEAEGWKNPPKYKKALEAEIPLEYRQARDKVEQKVWQLLVLDSNGDGFDRIAVSRSKDGKDIFANLGVGEWSEKIVDEFKTDKGVKRAAFKIKLIELSKNGEKLKLYFTPLCQLDGWSFPEKIAKELENMDGLPVPCAFYASFNMEWFDIDMLLDLIDMQNRWLGETAAHLLKNHPWDLFFMHAHTPDHAYHAFINKLEPMVCKDKKVLSKFLDAECKFYQSLDRMIGKILEAIDDSTLVLITSDHGAVPTEGRMDEDFQGFNCQTILDVSGLTVYKKDKNGEDIVDWSKTKAICQRSVYIYVNLKGRDPEGIVEPGREYEELKDRIVDLLYEYKDPETGKHPIALALRKEDARMIGLYGDRIGDVVYGIRPEVSGEHGRQLPTGEYGMGSMKGLLIMAGPGIKKGVTLERTVWLTDIVPTLCHLLDLPVPENTEGAIIYQAFEDPNMKFREFDTLRKTYARLKNAVDKEKALTHNYG